MARTIAVVVAVAGIGGFALGWMVMGTRPGPSATTGIPPTQARPREVDPPIASQHEFPLRPEDMQNDRETPAIAVDGQGRVVVAWASQSGDSARTLFVARSTDGGASFEEPEAWRDVPIYRFTSHSGDRAMSYSTHVLPRLAAGPDGLYLGWVEAIDGGPDVAYRVARSTDGGRTFSEPVRVHGGEASRPGFTALAVGPDGAVQCGWLDGRNQAQQPFVALRPAGAEGFRPERLVYPGRDDQGVCPCCDVALARAPDGTQVVAFRNSDSGDRDVWLSRTLPGEPGEFEPPVPVTSGHWAFEGCPHDGPSLAMVGDRLHVLWMDAHTGKNRIYHARSPLGAWDFEPREVNPRAAGSQGHPKLVATGSGTLHAVWDEALGEDEAPSAHRHGEHHGHGSAPTGGGRAILYAATDRGGATFGPATALSPRPGAFQLQPAIAVGPDGAVLVAWNELDTEGKRVVVARLSPSAGGSGDSRPGNVSRAAKVQGNASGGVASDE